MKRLQIFIFLLVGAAAIFSQSAFAQNSKYFGNIRYNHVSPHVEIKGVIPLSKKQAINRPHFIFKFDEQNRITSIIDNSYNVVKRHHLASLGAYKTVINYAGNKETRTYFDINNKPMANSKGVYKEVYLYDNQHFKKQLNFFDKNDKPVESHWKITEYQWQKHNNLVIENRINLDAKKQPLSPYFVFETTAIEYDKKGNPFKHFNLNEQLQVTNNEVGIAYYQDEYLENGLHSKFSYFDKNDKLVNTQWGFSYAVKNYDDLDNYLNVDRYDVSNTFLPSRKSAKTNLAASVADQKEIIRISRGYLVLDDN